MRSSLLLAVLVGCGPAVPTHDRPPASTFERGILNGKNHVLRFEASPWELDRIAVGTGTTLNVARVPRLGHTIGPERWTAGATFSFAHGAGLDVTTAAVAEGVTAKVRCMKAGIFEFQMSAVDPDGTTSRDAIDIACVSPTRLSVDFGKLMPGVLLNYQLGGTIYVYVSRFGIGAGGQELQLTGDADVALAPQSQGLVAVVPAQSPSPNRIELVARSTGAEPSVISTGLEVKLPVKIVDVADWTLSLKFSHESVGGGSSAYFIHVSNRFVAPDQSPLYGMSGCAFQSFVGDTGTVEATNGGCDLYGPEGSTLYASDRVCVTVLGRTACAANPH